MNRRLHILAIALIVASTNVQAEVILQGRATLPANTFVAGPTSGAYIGGGAVEGRIT